MALKLTAGDDAVFVLELTKDKASFLINPSAIVKAAVVSIDLQTVLSGPVTCANTDPGADWPNSTVATVFQRTDTESITDYGPARLEVEVDDGGKLTWLTDIVIYKGVIA